MKATLALALSFFVIISVQSICQAQTEDIGTPSTPFSSESGRFTVETPDQPRLTHTEHSSFLGTIHVYTYRFKTPEANFSLAYSDIPKIGVFFAGKKSVLKRAKKNFLKKTKGKELEFYPLHHQGNPGMELKFQLFGEKPGDKNNGVARFFLLKNRVYVLVVTFTDVPTDWPMEKFLDSFQWVKKT